MAKARVRANGDGTIYKRSGDNRYCVSLYTDGKRLVRYAKSATEARLVLDAMKRDRDKGLVASPAAITTAQWLEVWLEQAQPYLRPSTYRGYEQNIRVHLKPGLGHLRLARLDPLTIQRFLVKKLDAHMSPTSVRYMLAVLRKSLSDAETHGYVARNAAKLVKTPGKSNFTAPMWDEEKARALLAAVEGHRLEGLFVLAMGAGLRLGEALGLTWENVDLDGGIIHIRKSLQRIGGKAVLTHVKSRSSIRSVPLTPELINRLRVHKAAQSAERLAAGVQWADTKLVFTTPLGTALDPSNVTHRLQQAMTSHGLRRVRFHDLRHACATLLLIQGVHPRVVMEILGHSQISVTLNTYTHVPDALTREAVGRLNTLLTSGRAAHE